MRPVKNAAGGEPTGGVSDTRFVAKVVLLLHRGCLARSSFATSSIPRTWLYRSCTLLLIIAGLAGNVMAQSSPTGGKSLDLSGRGASGANSFHLSSTVDDILADTSDTSIYDPITINQLRLLKEDAQPTWDPDDADPYKTRRVVQKALAIQLGRSLSRQIQQSELRGLYRDTLRTYKRAQDAFRYSVQDNGDFVSVSRKKKGRKLLELNMEFNAKQGLDPQIRIGDSVRFRYDYIYDRTMLEYGFNF